MRFNATMSKLKRWFFRVALLVLSVVLLLGGAMIYFYYHQEKLIQPVVNQINKQLVVEVDVGDIHLSFREFPLVSVAFTNVYIPEAVTGSSDTLISVEKAYLNFRPWDLWRDDIQVYGVSLDNGIVNLRAFADGSNNWSFWKPTDDTSSVNIALNEVLARDVLFRYSDGDVLVVDQVDFIKLNGNFSDREFRIKGKGDVEHRKLTVSDFSYNRSVAVKADFSVQKVGDDIVIESKQFLLENEPLHFQVSIMNKETDVYIAGDNLNAQSVKGLMPDAYRDALDWFDLDGRLDMAFSTHIPDVGASERLLDFALKDGGLDIRDRALRITDVQTNGTLQFGKDVRTQNGALDVEAFNGNIDGGSFNLTMGLEDFDRPLIELQADAKISLEKLFVLAGIDTLNNVGGKASFDLHFQNRFQSLNAITTRDFVTAQSAGSLQITDGSFQFKHSDLPYSNLNASCSLEKNDLRFDTLTIAAGKSDITFVGRLNNLLPFLLVPNELLVLEANAYSRYLLLDEFLAAQGQSDDPYVLRFPERVVAKLNMELNEFHFDSFSAKETEGTCILSPSGFQAKLKNVKTLNGSINYANLFIDGKEKPYKMQVIAKGEDINMNAMFDAFHNFGQDVITSRELHGTLSADVNLLAVLTPNLNIPLNSITADATLQLDNGRLVHFEPMEALSRFARLEELRDVRFNTLSNTLSINNGVIYIPAMDIRSNVLDIEFEGTHTFDNDIDYVVRMDLREALFAERKRKKSEFDDIMIIPSEGGARLWVTMKGPVSNPRISLDNRQIRRSLSDQMREQGRQLRGEEKTEPKQQYEFEVEW